MSPLRHKTLSAAIALVVCGLCLTFVSCKPGAPEAEDELAGVTQFVANGSFEDMDGQNPKGWRPRSWQRGGAEFAVASIGHTGARSVMVSSEKGADASWMAAVPELRATACWTPQYSANRRSSSWAFLPWTSMPDLRTSTTALTSSSPIIGFDIGIITSSSSSCPLIKIAGSWGARPCRPKLNPAYRISSKPRREVEFRLEIPSRYSE